MSEIVITKWSVDHCGCILNYSWERASSENTRVHTYVGHDKRCLDHEHLIEKPLYDAVLEENQRKNILLQHAVDAHPQKLARQIVDKNSGQILNIPKDDLVYRFFYTGRAPDRILNVTFSEPLTEQEKKLVEARFPGKVIVL